MIRPARFGDIPNLWRLIQEMYERSIYVGRDKPYEKVAKALLMDAINRHGMTAPGGTNVMVTDAVDAFMVGVTERVYHIGHKLMATDIFFYVSEEADPRSFLALLRDFEKWAENNERVIEITLGASNAVGDWERLGAIYARRGYSQSGGMFEKRLER